MSNQCRLDKLPERAEGVPDSQGSLSVAEGGLFINGHWSFRYLHPCHFTQRRLLSAPVKSSYLVLIH